MSSTESSIEDEALMLDDDSSETALSKKSAKSVELKDATSADVSEEVVERVTDIAEHIVSDQLSKSSSFPRIAQSFSRDREYSFSSVNSSATSNCCHFEAKNRLAVKCQTTWDWDNDILLMQQSLGITRGVQTGVGDDDDTYPVDVEMPYLREIYDQLDKEYHQQHKDVPKGYGDEISPEEVGPYLISGYGPPLILQNTLESRKRAANGCDASGQPCLGPQYTSHYEILDDQLLDYIFSIDSTARDRVIRGVEICPFCAAEIIHGHYCCDRFLEFSEDIERWGDGQNRDLEKDQLSDSLDNRGGGRIKSRDRSSWLDKEESGKKGQQRELKSSQSKQLDRAAAAQKKKERLAAAKERAAAARVRAAAAAAARAEKLRAAGGGGDKGAAGVTSSNKPKTGEGDGDEGTDLTAVQQRGMVKDKIVTLTYQLSVTKFIEDGWTILPKEPIPVDDVVDDDPGFSCLSDTLQPDQPLYQEKSERRPVMRYYDSGSLFIAIFPDGSGSVFYPSGRLAVSVVSVGDGLFTYIVQHDTEESGIAAVFQPTGYGVVHFDNGHLRICLNPCGGVELNENGSRRRAWNWNETNASSFDVDNEPFPTMCTITLGVNYNCGLRIFSQNNISLTFAAERRSCRFHVGAHFKRNKSKKLATLTDTFTKNMAFLRQAKSNIEQILFKILTVLQFPNSPKLDRIQLLPHLKNCRKQVPRKLVSIQEEKRDSCRSSFGATAVR